MKETFGVGSRIYAVELYDAINRFDYDLDFYLGLSQDAKGAVLELCCGTGRLTLPIRQAGVDITGLDFTPAMLQRAREKFKAHGLEGSLVAGDMRNFSLDRAFSLIFIPFNSFLNTYHFEDINAIFSAVKAHLEEGGIFAFDIFNPNLDYLRRDESRLEPIMDFYLDTGARVKISQSMKYDRLHQVNRVKWHHEVDGESFVEQLDMRCFFPQEINAMLRYSGFDIIAKFGDFRRSTFTGDSAHQVFIFKVAS